jgi:hypothetical protein
MVLILLRVSKNKRTRKNNAGDQSGTAPVFSIEPLAKRQFCKFAGGDRLRPTEAGFGVTRCFPTTYELQPKTANGREQTRRWGFARSSIESVLKLTGGEGCGWSGAAGMLGFDANSISKLHGQFRNRIGIS